MASVITSAVVLLSLLLSHVGSEFYPVTSPFGDLVRFTDPAFWSQIVVSQTECAMHCAFTSARGTSTCRAFSYNRTSSNCSLFNKDLVTYVIDTSKDSSTYQFADQPLKSPWPTVPANQCDSPYEYGDQLYNGCRFVTATANYNCVRGHYGCCLATGQQAFCIPSSGGSNMPYTTHLYVDAKNCSFPYTYNGNLYYSCMRNIVNVTNDCHPAACMTTGQILAKCKPPADFTANVSNYAVNLTGQSTTQTLSVNGWIAFMWRDRTATDDWSVGWRDYVNGFRFTQTNFWLGLERIHQLTSYGNWMLRLEYHYWNSIWVSAEYQTVIVGDSSSNYTLIVDGFSGDDGNKLCAMGSQQQSIWTANGTKFSTWDKDNDSHPGYSCAAQADYNTASGGWWYNSCGELFFTFRIPKTTNGTHEAIVDEVHLMIKAR